MFGSRERGEASGAGLCSFPKVVTRCLPRGLPFKNGFQDFPSSPGVRTMPSKSGVQRAKIPYAS